MEAIATVRAGGRALLLSASHAESPVSTVLIVVPLVGSCGPTTRPWLRMEKHFQRGQVLTRGAFRSFCLKRGWHPPLIFSHALLVDITITTAYLGKLDSKLNANSKQTGK